MFDIGFWELALIGVVALLVVGPERLPALARTAGVWVGRARRFIGSVKDDIEREIRAEELKQVLNKTDEFKGVHEILEETKESLDKASRDLGSDVLASPGIASETAESTSESDTASLEHAGESTSKDGAESSER